MLPDRVSNLGHLTYESGALPIALRGPAKHKRRPFWLYKGIGMLKLGRMHRQAGETFVDPTAMSRRMREVSDSWSLQPLTTFGDFRCGVLLFMVILVIYNIKIGKNSC